MNKWILNAILALALVGPAAAAEMTGKQADVRAKRIVNQALSVLKEGEAERAIGLLETVPKLFPQSRYAAQARLEIGRYQLGKGRNDEALANLRLVADTPDRDVLAEAMLLAARANRASGKEGEAAMLLRRVTSEYPDSVFANDAWFEIGQIHFNAKRWTRAEEAFRRVGTAVPQAAEDGKAAADTFVEAGQRLYVNVDDQDLPIESAQGKALEVQVVARSGDRETVTLETYGTGDASARASVPTVANPTQPGDGQLTVQGGDELTVTYVDRADTVGGQNVKRTSKVKVVSTGILACLDGAYRQTVKGVFAGNPAFLRLRDLDLDTTDKPDSVEVSVTSYRRRPKPTDEEIARGEAPDPEADPWIEVASGKVRLVETAPRSGVFEGRVTPVVDRTPGDGEIESVADGKLVFGYSDARHLGGDVPRDVSCEVAVLTGGTTEPQSIVSSASDPSLQCRKLLVEAKLLSQWGGIFRDTGLEKPAAAKADEGLAKIDEIFTLARRQAIERETLENAYATKWDLLLVKGKLNEAIAVCHQLLREYPDTVLADVALMRIAKVRGASKSIWELNEAARIYRSVLSMPNSGVKAEAQYLLAGVLERTAKYRATGDRKPDYSTAIAAYRACAENYPQSSYAGESFKKIVNWQTEKKDYDRAVETLERVLQDYPDAPWLDEMLLRWGIVCYRRGDRAGAIEKFTRVREEYPSGSAAAQAASFLERLAAQGN